MRMQLETRSALQIGALVLTGMSLAAALGRAPLGLVDARTLLYCVVGLVPLLFLRGQALVRYLGPSITFAGAVGFIVLAGNWAKCTLGTDGCLQHDVRRVAIAAGVYGVLVIAGLLIMRRILRKPAG